MRLNEITELSKLHSFVDDFVKTHVNSIPNRSADEIFAHIQDVLNLQLRPKLNNFFKENGHNLTIKNITLEKFKNFSGAYFEPITKDQTFELDHGNIWIKIPFVQHEAFQQHKEYFQNYLIGCIVHESGHGIQLINGDRTSTLAQAEKRLQSASEDNRYFKYLTNKIEIEMTSYSVAFELMTVAKENDMTTKELFKLAVNDPDKFLSLIKIPGIIALYSVFKAFYKFPDSREKSDGLKRYLKTIYQYIDQLEPNRIDEMPNLITADKPKMNLLLNQYNDPDKRNYQSIRKDLIDLGNGFYYSEHQGHNVLVFNEEDKIEFISELAERKIYANDSIKQFLEQTLVIKTNPQIATEDMFDAIMWVVNHTGSNGLISSINQTIGGQKLWIKLLTLAEKQGYNVGFYSATDDDITITSSANVIGNFDKLYSQSARNYQLVIISKM